MKSKRRRLRPWWWTLPEVEFTCNGTTLPAPHRMHTNGLFTGVLKREAVTISMDGRGRAFDNIFVECLWRSVKHEDVYLNGYAAMGELLMGLTKYFVFYNGERPHQAWEVRHRIPCIQTQGAVVQ